jgi:hypothetical protein
MEVTHGGIRIRKRTVLFHDRHDICHENSSGFDKRKPALADIDSRSLHSSRSSIMSAEDDRLSLPEDLANCFQYCTSIGAFICAVWTGLRQAVAGTLVYLLLRRLGTDFGEELTSGSVW